MQTVGTRELKQNPAAAIQRVLESGESVEITAYGHPTGVVLAPEGTVPARWVPGAALADLTPLDPAEAERWHADSEPEPTDDIRDPWGGRA
ncbi:type II toxin-antitoxin system Phd/YefM family antitoxin [Promicromonospora sp. Marseille-Q5078]